mmetsp:Transcript_7073/g.14741  ORF Transcript_7073/g.14741 Transcript_7073/m.14741 type:complete len:310 (-) Transcript_7073:151-1080(-)
MFDSGGDGICCEHGEGSFSLIVDQDQVIHEDDGQFGDQSERIYFTLAAMNETQPGLPPDFTFSPSFRPTDPPTKVPTFQPTPVPTETPTTATPTTALPTAPFTATPTRTDPPSMGAQCRCELPDEGLYPPPPSMSKSAKTPSVPPPSGSGKSPKGSSSMEHLELRKKPKSPDKRPYRLVKSTKSPTYTPTIQPSISVSPSQVSKKSKKSSKDQKPTKTTKKKKYTGGENGDDDDDDDDGYFEFIVIDGITVIPSWMPPCDCQTTGGKKAPSHCDNDNDSDMQRNTRGWETHGHRRRQLEGSGETFPCPF